jgi:hypothetical protein
MPGYHSLKSGEVLSQVNLVVSQDVRVLGDIWM